MIRIKINNKEFSAKAGMSVYEAATSAGYDIPTMCYNREAGRFPSCMVCVVKDSSSGRLVPSCSTSVSDDMDIIVDDNEVMEARKTALELLLSDHTGDCDAPCRIACPAHMDIPLMNKLLSKGMINEALETVRKDIALPSVLGRICNAPCEKVCLRKNIDEPVSICLLKRFAGDEGVAKEPVVKKRDKPGKIAVIGAGAAGLSAAWYLNIRGFKCSLFEKNISAGGAMRYAIDDDKLDKTVLDREVKQILDAGVEFFASISIEKERFHEIVREYDAVVVATGNFNEEMKEWGLENNNKQVLVNKRNYLTNIPNVFAIGNVNRTMKQAIRSAAQGRAVADSIEQLLENKEFRGRERLFNSKVGKIKPEEHDTYLQNASAALRVKPSGSIKDGYTAEEVKQEADRCMHCECLKPGDCKLRLYSGTYKATQKRFGYEERKTIERIARHDRVVYEPGKCIKCGICVRLTARHGEKYGMTYTGRGFDVKIDVPFDAGLEKGLEETAVLVAEACPTGALGVTGDG